MAPPRTYEPAEVIVRMYNVGFGDCFLVSFRYPEPFPAGRQYRHVLVDFGSTQRPKAGTTLGQVAESINDVTGGQVDVVVATHRHADHISGFGADATAPIMDRFAPTKVIRPWTDKPDADQNATGPDRLDDASRDFLRVLDARTCWLNDLASQAAGRSEHRRVGRLVDDQLPNQSAIDRLDAWSKNHRGVYVRAGKALKMARVIPGVFFEVLGPPTLQQVPNLASETFKSDEFWLGTPTGVLAPLQSDRRLAAAYQQLAAPGGRGEARWILSRLSDGETNLLFNVVRAFDDALNNTSVILLIQAGSRTLLLSGDAQIENWQHVLNLLKKNTASAERLRSALADIDLYKVGHHGSRNATPKHLYALWDSPGRRVPKKMVTLLSTLPGKHGNDNPVPKQNLVDALEVVSTLHRTDTLGAGQPFLEVRASTTGHDGFAPNGA